MAKNKKQTVAKEEASTETIVGSTTETLAETTNTEAPAETTNTEAPPAPTLTIQDMITLKSAIELGSQRGAWRANELTAVGIVYERLSAFVQSVMPPAEEKPEGDAPKETKGE